jgi:hypothetical protein
VGLGAGHEDSGSTCAQTGQAPRDLSRVSTIERHHRVRDQLERPRRKRGQRRSELRATIGGCDIGMPTPLAREHHGDEHLEPLQAIAAVSITAALAVLHLACNGAIMDSCRVAVVVVWRGMRGLGSAAAQRRWAHSVPHSGRARARRSAAVVGAPERPAQQSDDTHCARRRADTHRRRTEVARCEYSEYPMCAAQDPHASSACNHDDRRCVKRL